MSSDLFKKRSTQQIAELVEEYGPPEPRVVHYNEETEWDPEMLCTVSEHELHVLGRSGDIVVFFDFDGNVTGWRDDGRKGSEKPTVLDRRGFLQAMITRLDLPRATRLGDLRPVELPPVGWTHEAVLFLKPQPTRREDTLRVWVDSNTLRVIQCLYGASPDPVEKP